MHVVSDDERRRVAEMLRELDIVTDITGWEWMRGNLFGLNIMAKTEDAVRSGLNRLADLIDPGDTSQGRRDTVACDREPSVDEGEPPCNLYSLYEAVFRRRPRSRCSIEDDEVRELVGRLLDICNAPGHVLIEPHMKLYDSPDSSNKEARGTHEPVVDRDALLALADEMDGLGLNGFSSGWSSGAVNVGSFARRIREACGEAWR